MVSCIKIRDLYCDPRYQEFLLDSDDTSALPDSKNGNGAFHPCAIGSIAYTADESIKYRLGNDDKWHKVTVASGSGSVGGSGSGNGSGDSSGEGTNPSPEEVEPIPDNDISSLFGGD